MKMLMLVILIYVIMAICHVLSLIKKKYWKELIISLSFLMFSILLTILYTIGVNIPSPSKPVQYLIEDILKLKYPK